MTPHDMRIAIAEFEGWKRGQPFSGTLLPDYTTDLNAIARAEAKLNESSGE